VFAQAGMMRGVRWEVEAEDMLSLLRGYVLRSEKGQTIINIK
jgi:hypothetical protein